jgi:predicted lipoprotein with Yx(FWY)xxD motif
MRVKIVVALVIIAAAALVTTTVAFAIGQRSNRSSSSQATLKVSTRTLPRLGKVLVNSAGRTLYMFVPDKRKKVTCVRVCARIWPPLKVSAGEKFSVAGGVKAALLGSDRNPAGGRVATYNHWPLYLYVGDHKAGVATGQALKLNGGLWYVMSPSGAIIKKTAAPPPPKPCGSDGDMDGDQGGGLPDDGDGCL